MNTQTKKFLELWVEARTRFSHQLRTMRTEDLRKKLLPSPNSAGFLLRHIADVELLFAKNVFGASDIKIIAKTVITKQDTGDWVNLKELIEYAAFSHEALKTIIETQSDQDWESTVTTPEFGIKTKAEALGRIVSHTAYHAGQIAIISRYGDSEAT